MMFYQDHVSTDSTLGSDPHAEPRHVTADPSSHTIASVQQQNHPMPLVSSPEVLPPSVPGAGGRDGLSTGLPPEPQEMTAVASGYEGRGISSVVEALSVQAMWDRARLISTADEPQNQHMFHQWLGELRQHYAYDLSTLTQITKISPAYLEALFTGELSTIPHESLVRGFVQCLAQLLSPNPDPIMFAYRSCYQREFTEPALVSSPHATGLLLQPVSKMAGAKLHGRVAVQWLCSSVLQYPWRSAALAMAILFMSWLVYVTVARSGDHGGDSLSKTYGFLSYPLASVPESYGRAELPEFLHNAKLYHVTSHHEMTTTAANAWDELLGNERARLGLDAHEATSETAGSPRAFLVQGPVLSKTTPRRADRRTGAVAASRTSPGRDHLASYSPSPAIIKTQIESWLSLTSSSPLASASSVDGFVQGSSRRGRADGEVPGAAHRDLGALAARSVRWRPPLPQLWSQLPPPASAAAFARTQAASRHLPGAFLEQQAPLLVTDHHPNQGQPEHARPLP